MNNAIRGLLWRYAVIKSIFRKIFGYCRCCRQWFVYPKKRRTNTAYVEDDLNYCYLCKGCYILEEEYWAERWKDYYDDIL